VLFPDIDEVLGLLNGLAVTELLIELTHPLSSCVAVYVPDVTVLGLPEPPSLQISVPTIPFAVTTELPQLFNKDKAGAAGTANGLAVTTLLKELTHPATVCVTLNEPELIILGLPVPKSDQFNVPLNPLAVICELPQLFIIDKVGALGTGVGVAVTAMLGALMHPLMLWVTV
jgi:hypothetical protein